MKKHKNFAFNIFIIIAILLSLTLIAGASTQLPANAQAIVSGQTRGPRGRGNGGFFGGGPGRRGPRRARIQQSTTDRALSESFRLEQANRNGEFNILIDENFQ